MDRPTPNNNLEDTPWPNTGLESWRSDVLRESASFFVTPSPEPLAAPRSIPAVGGPSYNYQVQYPAIPVAQPFVPPPISVPSVYLNQNIFPKPIDQGNPNHVPTHSNITAFAPESPYPDGYPSPWSEFPPSPSTPKIGGPHKDTSHTPMAKYLCPNMRPTSKRSLSLTSVHSGSTALSATSTCDPDYLSPRTDVTPSPSTSNQDNPLDEVDKGPSRAKRPCLTRGTSKKNDGNVGGTFQCWWQRKTKAPVPQITQLPLLITLLELWLNVAFVLRR
ncbi:hypothetical protein PENANT_c017G07101 [Penicillium antarcticum]|uniref:Uncharacterized protein n=1 Tax=Penicillium antarcticum TaxID=416450 RepID=A0A1V6Q214_9EURO|nr:hypothetical protein PENANT_c017G07101 [Penicillium antarcticum]